MAEDKLKILDIGLRAATLILSLASGWVAAEQMKNTVSNEVSRQLASNTTNESV